MTRTNNLRTRVQELSSFIVQNAPQACKSVLESDSTLARGELKNEAQAIIEACQELAALLSEPYEWMAHAAWAYMDTVALSLVLEMKIHHHIQEGDGPTSLAQLAKVTGGSVNLIKRVMRQCVKRSIFEEVKPENYRHNDRSICLLHHEFSSLIHYLADDGLLCGAHLARSTLQNNLQIPDDPLQSAFQLAFNTNKTLYDYYHSVDQERGSRFAEAMAGHYNTPLDEPIENIFPFNSVDPNALIVDIGGGNGQHSMRLGRKFPGMSFIVQDHVSVIESAQNNFPGPTTGRIQWQSQDIFSPQQVEGASIYLLSHVLMDHSDSDCATMIKNISNVMRPGISKILVHDFVDPGRDEYASPFLNSLDLHMIASLNGFSRSYKDWLDLFCSADPRLSLQRFCKGPKNSAVFELLLLNVEHHVV